jgi:hypothetical protein
MPLTGCRRNQVFCHYPHHSQPLQLTAPLSPPSIWMCSFIFEWRSTLQPKRTKQLIKTINDLGSVVEAAQRLVLQVLGMAALIYLVVQAILR